MTSIGDRIWKIVGTIAVAVVVGQFVLTGWNAWLANERNEDRLTWDRASCEAHNDIRAESNDRAAKLRDLMTREAIAWDRIGAIIEGMDEGGPADDVAHEFTALALDAQRLASTVDTLELIHCQEAVGTARTAEVAP